MVATAMDPLVPTKEAREPITVTPEEIIYQRRVRVLELAAELDAILSRGDLPDLELLEARFAPASMTSPQVTVTLPSAGAYDALLNNDVAELSA